MLARNQRIQKLIGGTFLERMVIGAVSRAELFFMGGHKDKQTMRLVRRVRRERTSLLTAQEAYTVYSLARAYCHLPGEMAEVGVFQGASAKLLCEGKGNVRLHLFDTFTGLPKSSRPDGFVHSEKQYPCSLESVQSYLKGYDNVCFHPGRFPASAESLDGESFSFVHMDVDLYESTSACLSYFYPRMLSGGVMLSHDYSILAGVRRAVDEFFADKREKPIELPSTQCMIIKL